LCGLGLTIALYGVADASAGVKADPFVTVADLSTAAGESAAAAVAAPGFSVPGPRPRRGSVYAVDSAGLATMLATAPLARLDRRLGDYGLAISLPGPHGVLVPCMIAESAVMEPELQAKFPAIRTYIVQSLDGTASGRIELAPRGLTGMLRSAGPESGAVWMIDLWQSGDPSHVVVYHLADLPGGGDFVCHTDELPPEAGAGVMNPQGDGGGEGLMGPQAVRTYRTLRLAMACTGEYGQRQSEIQGRAPNAADAFAAIVTVVSRTNVVYEADMAIHFSLVANNDQLVFFDPATDPFSTSCDGQLGANCSFEYLSQNISTLNTRIGNANFDIGHLMTRVFGGVAYLRAACGTNKAGGISGIPRGGDLDPLTALVAIHELGHQFGANHTFSGTRGRCAGNVNLATAWEAGSGSSPMAYPGACPVGGAEPTDNIVTFAEPFFHHGSINEMTTFVSGITCPVQTTTSNNIPVILSTTPSVAIPPGTPFVLTATASDADGDVLTYSWEQFDSGTARPLSGAGAVDNGAGALFRVFMPVTSPQRTFPRMADVLSGVTTPGERLPTVTGVVRKFRVIVRDNRPAAGGVAVSPLVNLTIAAGSSPFAVVSPVEGAVVRGGLATVTWTVGGTDVAPIGCSTVNVRLSFDDGATFGQSLGIFSNTGSANVTLPFVANTAARARVRIDANGQIFFAVSRPFVLRTCSIADVASDSTDVVLKPNGAVGAEDLDAFIAAFLAGNVAVADVASDSLDVDRNPNGAVGSEDLDAFISGFIAGC